MAGIFPGQIPAFVEAYGTLAHQGCPSSPIFVDGEELLPMWKKHCPARCHGMVLGLYAALALALSWPLPRYLTSRVPGVAQWAFDESTFLWNAWYLKHALVDRLSNPLHTELIYYPLGIDLILHTYNFFHALLAQPMMLAVNLPFASNVALLLSTVLSAYGTFLLVFWLLRKTGRQRGIRAAAVVAGLLYAFASNRAVYAALGHYDMVTTQWIPFYGLMLLRSLDGTLPARRRYRAAALAGFFLALNGLAEMITAMFLGLFTGLVLLWWAVNWLKDRRGQATWPAPPVSPAGVLAALTLTGGVTALVWGPALVPILLQFLTADFALKGWGEAIPLSVDLLGLFTPTVLHPVFGGDLVAELRRVQLRALEMGVTGFRDVNTVFLGWTSLALALVGALALGRRVRLWIWTAMLFGLFALGPFLQINGRYRFDLDGVEATFPLPYALLHYIPIVKANRAPNRNSVILMLALAVLAGYGLHWLLQRLPTGRGGRFYSGLLPALLAGLILFEHLAVPAPLSDARIPQVYAQIAADPRPVSVLQLPLGWRNSFGTWGPERTQLQYFQTAHGKPMLGGNISRAPDFKMAYFQRIPLFQALVDAQVDGKVTPELAEAARAQADELMYLYNVGYVLLFPPIPQRFPYVDHWQTAWDFAREVLPLEEEPFWRGEGIEAYRVRQPEGADHFRLDLGQPGTYPYRGEGWDIAETDAPYEVDAIWATARTSRLFVPLRQVDPAAGYTVAVRAHPFAYPGSEPQTLALAVNGRLLETQTLADGWQEVTWTVPGSALVDGLNRLELRWGATAVPRTVLGGSRQIGSTGVSLPVDADLKGFADGGYIALFDEAGNQVDAAAGRRGVNVTVLDPESGAVLDKVGFDTAANVYESQALADYLARIQPGHPVLVVSHGDATAHLTEEAVAGLRGLGVDVTLAALQGQHFAIIGVQGAAPGTALAVLDPQEAFLRLSLNPDRRPLAAAVDWVEIRSP